MTASFLAEAPAQRSSRLMGAGCGTNTQLGARTGAGKRQPKSCVVSSDWNASEPGRDLASRRHEQTMSVAAASTHGDVLSIALGEGVRYGPRD